MSYKPNILLVGSIPKELGGIRAGGVATLTWGLARECKKHGYAVTLLSNTKKFNTVEGIDIYPRITPGKFKREAQGLFEYISHVAANNKALQGYTLRQKLNICHDFFVLRRVIELVRPDIIHIMHIIDHITLATAVRDIGYPVVATENAAGLLVHHDLFKAFQFHNKEHFLTTVQTDIDHVDWIISPTTFASRSFRNTWDMPSNVRHTIIPYPVFRDIIPLYERSSAREDLSLGTEKKIVLFCAASLPFKRKRLDILLECFRSSKELQEQAHLVVITRGEALQRVKDFLEQYDIDGTVFGHQPWDKLLKFYNAADVFVMPSSQEGFGLVYYESLLAGTPVIGFHESIEELNNILNVNVGTPFNVHTMDSEVLAGMIVEVLQTTFDRTALRRSVVENLSWNVLFDKFDSIYTDLVT